MEDEALLTCPCGNKTWLIGTSGVCCEKCFRYLPSGYVVSNVRRVNRLISVAYRVETLGEPDDRGTSEELDRYS